MDTYEMSTSKPVARIVGLILVAVVSMRTASWATDEAAGYGLGRPATAAEIAAWDIDASPTGAGLPPGQGTVTQGAQVFARKCAACHGPTGIEGPKDTLVGGRDTLTTSKPIKTIGSYWPYATTVFDYIRRAMPFNAPQSLTAEETYSVIAWLLFKNDIIPEDRLIDATTLPQVQMPNRDGFIRDARPDIR
jgi:cytochrome c